MTIFSVQSTLFTRASVALLSSNGLKRFSFASSFSSNALYSPPLPKTKKRRFPIVSAVDIGGVTVARNDDDPTNNVPDSIFESNYANCYHQARALTTHTYYVDS